ncbi:MAG: alpha-mannosidase [Chloroflexi bacterium]|nr:alpha-mannosidase [Chloroflexota bacterium]
MYHKQRWTPEKIKQRLELIAPLVYIKRQTLPPFKYRELENPLAPPPVDSHVDDSQWTEITANAYWGAWMQDFVLRTTFTIPEWMDAKQPIALYLPLGDAGDFSHPECLAYIDGVPYAACDRHHQEILLKPEWRDGKEHTLALHGWTGLGGAADGDFHTKLYMRPCAVVQIHPPTRDVIALSRIALETANNLDDNNPAKHLLLNALNEAFIALDTRLLSQNPQEFYDSVLPAAQILKDGIAQAGAPMDVVIHATGHAHIDVAWLWTLGQTRRKSERTFYNVIRLMEQFPHYHFSQSQPQLYQFIKEDQPQLFEAIKQRIHEGRWEPMGGMWVEADCNLSGAESLARQFLLGRTFFKEHFGKDAESPVLWLPDVFGYAWALPQLIKQAGLKYFMTIKIGWSQYNRLPYDTFLWQGIDGTQVLTHFSTVPDPGMYASTYNAMADAREALGTWQNFLQKDLHKNLLMAYGFGDGGGGPTREMLENIEVMKHFPSLPQVKQSSVKTFFETLERELTEKNRTPVWNGELYLEYHRGTYTTQARNKRANRKSEFLLHDTEFIATLASLITNYQYPITAFRNAWQTICLNQFHDIIPGSSIAAVYEESQAQYAELATDMTQLCNEALNSIANHLDADLILVNPTSFTQPALVFVPGDPFQRFTLDGEPVPVQQADSGVWLDAGMMSPYSVVALKKTADGRPQTTESPSPAGREGRGEGQPSAVSGLVLENNFLRVEFNSAGDVTRIYDKSARREVLPPNAIANQFQAFEDRPKSWDAWDVDIFYDDKMWLAEPATSIQFVEYGELRQTVEIKRKILNSEYTQRISLNHNSPRLDFDTHIHWQERHTLLKVAFPVDVLAPQATYEIQWGNVTRPTHRNISWDWARFETCAHKWVDLSEGGCGVSLLNDCKYGHDIHNNVMRITLLRSPTLPDPLADFGEHQFTYSFYPHAGLWNEETQREAYLLNDPIIAYKTADDRPTTVTSSQRSTVSGLPSLVACDSPNVIIETVKQAEDGDGIIVRLYESQRKRGQVQVRMGVAVDSAWLTNLLEENESALSVENDSIILNLKPYQIATLRIKVKK